QVDNAAIAPLAILYSYRPGTCQSAKRGTLPQLLENRLGCLAVRHHDAPDGPLVLGGRQFNCGHATDEKIHQAEHTIDRVQSIAPIRRTSPNIPSVCHDLYP